MNYHQRSTQTQSIAIIKLTKEQSFPCGVEEEIWWRGPQQLHDAGELFRFVLTREQGVARVEFRKDATWAQKLKLRHLSLI